MVDAHDIRYTYITDITYLRQWVSQPEILKWFPMGSEKEVEDALQCWIGFSRWSCSLTATINHVPCGIGTLFLMPYKKVAHHCLSKMVVDPKWQRQGIGRSLLRNMKHLAKNYFHLEMVDMEIFEGNPIYSLLLQEGFKEVFSQPDFVDLEGKKKARMVMEAVL